jgi:hypothetical protein
VIALGAITPSTHAAVFSYVANLDGPSEFPPNASPGTGFAEVDYNDILHTLQVQVTFSGLLGTTTASHIHAPTASPATGTAGVATTTPYFSGFPIGVTSGSYSNLLDLTLASSWNPAFITANGGTTAGAEVALASAMAADESYLNIHTTVVPGGEIRGFLVAVPEPSSLILLALGGPALVWAARRRKTA